MEQAPANIILMGRSGAGKGTQAKLLLEHFGNLHYVYTGDLFRRLSQSGSHAARKIEEILARGGLPFDDLATTLWMHDIAHTVKENEGILFDGSPRRKQEAENLDRFLDFLERRDNSFPIFLDVSQDVAYGRLSERGRSDDTPEAIKNRLDYFNETAVHAVKHYEEQGRLIRIDGEQPIEKVFQDIISFILHP